ncbi:hypothetical protein OVS_04230 [Mycoplasma ovis str. Michigan]|uniref:Uncharacterized protein n=1 Tax=Mycoplasma ovis str. Michigan TaxID=1415773 RepID=A0ABM5P299_9MOLU|nr:hypothetical protein OVS_04230 [Mycoplasma ovis str. Michigan]
MSSLGLGSGLTGTLFAVSSHNYPQENVVQVEDDVSRNVEGDVETQESEEFDATSGVKENVDVQGLESQAELQIPEKDNQHNEGSRKDFKLQTEEVAKNEMEPQEDKGKQDEEPEGAILPKSLETSSDKSETTSVASEQVPKETFPKTSPETTKESTRADQAIHSKGNGFSFQKKESSDILAEGYEWSVKECDRNEKEGLMTFSCRQIDVSTPNTLITFSLSPNSIPELKDKDWSKLRELSISSPNLDNEITLKLVFEDGYSQKQVDILLKEFKDSKSN